MSSTTTFCLEVELGGLDDQMTWMSVKLAAGPRAATMAMWQEEEVTKYSIEGHGELEGAEEEELVAFFDAWYEGIDEGLEQQQFGELMDQILQLLGHFQADGPVPQAEGESE